MTRRHRARATGALILLTWTAACAGRTHAGAPRGDAATAIRAVLDSTALGWNRGDLAMYLAAYDEGITSRGATGFVRGKTAAEQVMRDGFWKDGRPAQQLRYEHLDIRPLGADHALMTGQFVLTGGGRPDRTGWFTTVWARTAKGWRMIHDHS
jgi:ketosteroid isomerase-like protein